MPNSPSLRVILPRFSNTYLVWRDPEPFVGDILGVQIRYLIDCIPQNIPELGSGVNHYSVSGIKSSAGKTHSISLRARTSAGCGSFSTPQVFTFQPTGKLSDEHNKVKHNFLLKSARDLGASIKQRNKWCQMCALTHCRTVEIRMSKSLAFWHCCVCVCASCCLLHTAGQAFWLNVMHIQTSGKVLSYIRHVTPPSHI